MTAFSLASPATISFHVHAVLATINSRPMAIVLAVGIAVFLILLLHAAKTRFGDKPTEQSDNEPPSNEGSP